MYLNQNTASDFNVTKPWTIDLELPDSEWQTLSWLFERAESALDDQDFHAAIPVYEKILNLSRGTSTGKRKIQLYSHLRLAEIYRECRNPIKLRKHFLAAIAIEPENAELRFQLGEALSSLNRNREAIIAYKAAHDRCPKQNRYQLKYASCLEQLGRVSEAEHVFQKAVEENPENPRILTEYALFLLDRHKKSEAEELLQKALRIAPENPGTLRALSLLRLLKADSKSEKELAKTPANEIARKIEKSPVDLNKETFGVRAGERTLENGFSHVVCEDAQWVDDGEMAEAYQVYLSRAHSEGQGNAIPFKVWRNYYEEFVRFMYWSALRDLDEQEQERLAYLQEQLLED